MENLQTTSVLMCSKVLMVLVAQDFELALVKLLSFMCRNNGVDSQHVWMVVLLEKGLIINCDSKCKF
jgi:ribosomal protein L7Ae-like RNA K-turn-binding protein